MKAFVFDTIVDADNICNLLNEQKRLCKAVDSGKRIVLFGRRNTGKTSLIQSIVIPHFIEKNKKHFVFFADLLGIKSKEQVDQRFLIAFENSFSKAFTAKSLFIKMLESIKSMRPSINIDPNTGAPSLSLEIQPPKKNITFTEIIKQIGKIAEKVPTLIVLDEFQDIQFIEELEALMRDALQNIHHKIPVIILGSKKHLLWKMTAKPDSPFFNWGEDIEIPPIDYNDYCDYMNERFRPAKLKISLDVSKYLQDRLLRIPEAINIVCFTLIEILGSFERKMSKLTTISQNEVINAIRNTIERRQARFEEYLTRFTFNEEALLIQLAKGSPVEFPTGKEFSAKTNLSSRGISLILKKFEDEAVIYRTSEGIILSNPLLKEYLVHYRP